MSDDANNNSDATGSQPAATPEQRRGGRSLWTRSALVGSALGVLIFGAAAGAFAMHAMDRDRGEMMPLKPIAVSELTDDSIAAVQGNVAEIFGNKFILADASGRTLVDTGPDGRDGLVNPGETVTAQGRFDNGSLRAAMLTRADGKVEVLKMGPGRHGPRHGWRKHGEDRWRGDDDARPMRGPAPEEGPDAPPPAPPQN